MVNIKNELRKVENIYSTASDLTSIQSIKEFLVTLAKDKKQCSHELSGAEPQKDNQVKIKENLFTQGKVRTETLLVRCLNEEENLIKSYQKSLTRDSLNDQQALILLRQLNDALAAFNQLRAFKLSRSY